ncbi:MAG: hypothetical protein Q7O66_08850 [Dehalococcoidia bacterium]|nr:hypothetical protein [Dehalococcoidia bacterium]
MAENKVWEFPVALPAGSSVTLTTQSRLALGDDLTLGAFKARSLAYVLLSTDRWNAFQVLEIKVSLPANYRMAASAPLVKQGQSAGMTQYAGTFANLPGEVFMLSMQSVPNEFEDWLANHLAAVALGGPLHVALIAGAAGWLFGRLRRRWLAFLLGGVGDLILTLFVGLLVLAAVLDGDTMRQLNNELIDTMAVGYTNTVMLATFLLAPLCGSLVAAVWAAIAAVRRPTGD